MRGKVKTELHQDFFSLAAQLLREIRPSKLEEARAREQMKERQRRSSENYRKKNRERMKEARKKQ